MACDTAAGVSRLKEVLAVWGDRVMHLPEPEGEEKGRRPKPTQLFLGSASILRLESSAASVNCQPQFQEGSNRGSTARHSSHESPVINLPQLLWREHNLEPLSACH